MMKATLICAFLIGLSQPVVAQSIFDGFGEPEPTTRAAADYQKWERQVAQQLREHAPQFLNLGHGRVIIKFFVDRAGRVTNVDLGDYANSASNAQALIALSIISSLKLPRPPSSVGSDCCWLTQSFYFH